jgi:hypothetical protein
VPGRDSTHAGGRSGRGDNNNCGGGNIVCVSGPFETRRALRAAGGGNTGCDVNGPFGVTRLIRRALRAADGGRDA